jgi:hypothetical protein
MYNRKPNCQDAVPVLVKQLTIFPEELAVIKLLQTCSELGADVRDPPRTLL